MKKYKISDILHDAADKYLAHEFDQYWFNGGNKEKFSCCAVEEAVMRKFDDLNYIEKSELVSRIKVGLLNMGCDTGSINLFNDASNGAFVKENQQTRYAWLKFAALMAEEQGV